MNTLKPALLVLILAGATAAQVASSTASKPDVEVVKIGWRRVERNPKLDEATLAGPVTGMAAVNAARRNEANDARTNNPGAPRPPVILEGPSAVDSPPPRPRWSGYIYEFTIRNNGPKIIRNVVWEYSFTDPATQKTVGRRQYKSSVKIRPGMTARLVVRSILRPIGVIDATQPQQNWQEQPPEQMVIQRIKYADGSVWERDSH
jgi:hypothetical protein